MIHWVEPIDRANSNPSTSIHHSRHARPSGFHHKPTRKKLHPGHWRTGDHPASKFPSMPHCHPGGAPKSGTHRPPPPQMAQRAHRIGRSCCCPNSEPPRCLATQVTALFLQRSAQRSPPEHCIGHWCSRPNTQHCHRIVWRWSGNRLRRPQQTTRTARCIVPRRCCPNTAPSHQDGWRENVPFQRPPR